MYKNVAFVMFAVDKTKALGVVEPLDGAADTLAHRSFSPLLGLLLGLFPGSGLITVRIGPRRSLSCPPAC
jgi:hypothetical protein